MHDVVNDYLINLARLSDSISSSLSDSKAYWYPDEPPLTTIFSDVGRDIAQNINHFDGDLKKRVFIEIEKGITSSDDSLSTAVATGLIEAIVGYADRSGEWHIFQKGFGPISLAHAQAWLGN